MSYLIIYLIGISDGLSDALYLTGVSFLLVGLFGWVVDNLSEKDDSCKDLDLFRPFKNLWKVSIPILVLHSLLPNKETLIAMVTIPPVIEYVQGSEEIQKLPDNVVKFVNDYLTKEEDKE